MKGIKIIEKHLKANFKLDYAQLMYELKRFERHPDVGAELSQTLKRGEFPKTDAVTAVADGISYTAQIIYQNKYGSTVYASYSLLTQIRDDPKIAKAMTEGFKIK